MSLAASAGSAVGVGVRAGGGAGTRRAAVIGPNAVTQLARALDEARPGAAEALFRGAGMGDLLAHPPAAMIDEAVPRALFAALFAKHDAAEAMAVAARAGRHTADYVLANRIPRLARLALPRLPAPLSTSLLLGAVARASWTFAGSGVCTVEKRPPAIEIAANPLAMPSCAWHRAVFARLFEVLVAAPVEVRHTACCADRGSACRFEIVPRPSA